MNLFSTTDNLSADFFSTDDFLAESTTEGNKRKLSEAVLIAYDVLIIIQVSVMMFAMGAGVNVIDLKRKLRHPKAIILGIICQMVIMPFLCFAIAHMLNLENSISIGLVVVSGCPGGAPANLFTAVSRGDLSLSVCLTVISSVLALATTPLNNLIYLRSWTDELFVIPFVNVLIAIVATWIPTVLGMLVRFNYPKKAPKVTKIGGIIAFVILLVFAVIQNMVYPGLFLLPAEVWFAALIIPVLGWLVGFGFSAMFMLEIVQRRAIAFGTSYVNAGLMLALISITYGRQTEETNELIQYPMLYMATQLTVGILVMVLHTLYFAIKEDRTCCQKLYHKQIARLRPEDTFEEVMIGVGAPPLESQVRRYEDIIAQLFGDSCSSDETPPSYNTLDFGASYIEVDLNPNQPARKRASTIAHQNSIDRQTSIYSVDSADTDNTYVDHRQRRSSLPCLLEINAQHRHKLNGSESSGYMGSSHNLEDLNEEFIERF